jgi:hypothetical protein
MNNQIEQIAEEAGFIDGWFSESGDDCETKIKKFAELIIQECMEQCFSEDDEQRIAKHFGYHIEEEE